MDSHGHSLMATNTWPGSLAGGLTQLLIPPTAPKAGTKISDSLPPVPEKLIAKIRHAVGVRGAARAPPQMPCKVNALYWADSKVKGKEEAQRHKCMATVFRPLRGGFGLLKARTGPRLDGTHDLYSQGQPGV